MTSSVAGILNVDVDCAYISVLQALFRSKRFANLFAASEYTPQIFRDLGQNYQHRVKSLSIKRDVRAILPIPDANPSCPLNTQEDAVDVLRSILLTLAPKNKNDDMSFLYGATTERLLARPGDLEMFCRARTPFNECYFSVDVTSASILNSFTHQYNNLCDRYEFRYDGLSLMCYADEISFNDPGPGALIFVLKRFQICTRTGVQSKIKTPCSVPFSFDLTSLLNVSCNTAMYQLVSFIVHEGDQPHTGHYKAYLRGVSTSWWQCDDSRVTKIKNEALVRTEASRAYILFFDKVP